MDFSLYTHTHYVIYKFVHTRTLCNIHIHSSLYTHAHTVYNIHNYTYIIYKHILNIIYTFLCDITR